MALHAEPLPPQWQDWRWQLAHARTAADFGVKDHPTFPMRVTPYYASLADLSDSEDPIRLQFMADPRELIDDGYGPDPFGEQGAASLAPGIRQRFADRILAMMSLACSTYCRHCTRKGLLRECHTADLETLVRCVAERPKVREVLISGGDPLMNSDAAVLAWVDRLAGVEQLDAIRLCTRMPAVLPMRITEALADGLAKSGRVWVQTQFNHPCELTPDAVTACARLVCRGIPVSNQSVLLHGVNDRPEVMAELCAKLQRARVRPYYIFRCDPIAGIAHFRTPPEKAAEIRDYLLEHLGGLACPRVVVDLPGAPHKRDV